MVRVETIEAKGVHVDTIIQVRVEQCPGAGLTGDEFDHYFAKHLDSIFDALRKHYHAEDIRLMRKRSKPKK